MNDEQIRITVLTEMFLGLGHEPTPERIAYYDRLLRNVPTKWLRVACDHAVCASPNGFPPGPGEIIKHAEKLHRDHALAERREWAAQEWARVSSGAVEDAEEVGRIIDDALKH